MSCNIMTPLIFLFTIFLDVLLLPGFKAEQYGDDPYNNNYYYYNNQNSHDNYGGDYLSDWNHQEWAKMSGRIQQPKCVDIPENLTLCHGIGYEKMMLPNLLQHDSLSEVTQQAGSWVPLVRINCHPFAKVFLCSLFSPVCLDRLIYPCRSLCQAVQAACVGRMKAYGFDWPEMLNCNKFPLDNDMCINLVHEAKPDNSCVPCKHPLTHEALIDHFCRADVAMRVKLKEFKDVNGNKELVVRKKKKLFKHEGMSKKDVRSLTPIIEGGASCTCDTISDPKERYLIIGNKRDDQLVVNFGILWNRKDKEFKKGIRAIRKGNTCEGIFRELSANGMENKKSGGGKGDDKKKRRKGRKGKKRKGKKGKKRKGGKGKKGKGKKNKDKKKGDTDSNNASHKSELEDQALSNFMKAAN